MGNAFRVGGVCHVTCIDDKKNVFPGEQAAPISAFNVVADCFIVRNKLRYVCRGEELTLRYAAQIFLTAESSCPN